MPAATTVSMTSDARPVSGWSSIRQSRGPLLAAAVLLIFLLLALHRGATESAGGQAADECGNAEDELRGLSRHGRRRRRREVLTQVDLLPDQMARLQKARSRESGRAVEAMQSTLRVAKCIVRWPAELEQVERVQVQLRRTRLKLGLVVGNSTCRRRRLVAVGPTTTKRLTRGLSKFAGDDFACEERDMYRDAPWARNACLLKCKGLRCARAVALCERLPHCAGVDVNVEGTVATLKRESELSRRSSRLRPEVTVTRVQQLRPSLADLPCGLDDDGKTMASVAVASCPGCCVLDCPQLDCTRAIGLCFRRPTCPGVEIGFGIAGRAAVARLRMSAS